jgi:hypothetical protein
MVLASGPGCLSYIHCVPPPSTEQTDPCLDVPRSARNHVYIFLVHGLDPANLANLSGLCDYVQSLGFNKTYYGQLYHKDYFIGEIRRIHQADPEAHFVLIGFSFGANMVRDVAQAARKDDIFIDLLVYLGGNTLEDNERDQPDNVGRIINVLALGCIWNGAQMTRAENIQVPDRFHFGSPTHPRTLEAIARALGDVANQVPVPEPAQMAPLPKEEEDTAPKVLMSHTVHKRTEWDFLKPVSRLHMPSIKAKEGEQETPPAPDRIVSR